MNNTELRSQLLQEGWMDGSISAQWVDDAGTLQVEVEAPVWAPLWALYKQLPTQPDGSTPAAHIYDNTNQDNEPEARRCLMVELWDENGCPSGDKVENTYYKEGEALQALAYVTRFISARS